ncbi:MAG: SMP-30/gluconolactonase/LRE family protein, partial [Actinomycetota bacterium]|nr:SMP-30/gluconolactonase/LRE family protein [Actinomycetota bacterium]
MRIPSLHPARRARAVLALALLVATTAVVVPARPASAGTEVMNTLAGTGTPGSTGDNGEATAAQLNQPQDVAVDAAGNRYIADTSNHKVRRVDASGTITTFAGTGEAGSGGDGGPATSAQLNTPTSVVVDAAGNVYIADSLTNRVRRVDTAGNINNYAGSGRFGCRSGGDFKNPTGLALDGSGRLYVTDFGCNRVRRVETSGSITDIASVSAPRAIALDAAGNLYVTSDQAGIGVQRIDTSGAVSAFACTGSGGDGGPAVSASCNPRGVAVDGSGNVYISDIANNTVRKIDTSGIISAFAGDGTPGSSGDGGPATSAQLLAPFGVEVSGPVLYIADKSNHRVRTVADPPPAPTITGTTPASPANDNTPEVRGSAVTGGTVRLYTNSTCTSGVAGTGSTSTFASPGISVTAADNTTTTFWAKVTDVRGTSSCSSSSATYIEDSNAPVAPSIDAGPGTLGSDPTPTWSFSGEPGATFECQLAQGATVVSALAACLSPKTYDLSAQPDATYTFSVRQRDTAGNTSAAAAADYTLDRAAPATPTITSGPGATGSDVTPTWSFSGEAGASFECQLASGAPVVSGFAACSSPKAYDLSTQPDATYTFSVRQRDAAGNTGAAASTDYELDRTAPPEPLITEGPGPAGSDANPSWSFTGDTGVTFECQLSSGGTVLSPLSPCTSPKSYDLSAQPDATYTFSVRQVDGGGNQSALAISDYTLDRSVPAAPAITSGPGTTGSDANPAWSFTGEAGAAFECQLSSAATVISGFGGCNSPKAYDLSAQPDATYTFSVRQRDAAGNVSGPATSDYTLDRGVPAPPSITSGPGTTSSTANPTWAFSGEAGATFECQLSSGAAVISAFAPCTSPKAYDLSAQPDATYTFSARQRDAAGNVSAPATSDYTLDRGVPAAPTITSGPAPAGSDANPAWFFTGEPGAAFECQLSTGATVISTFSACNSPKSYDLSAQADGTYTFSVRQRDAAGNTSPATTSDYILDRGVPVAPTVTAPSPNPGNDATPTWSFTGETGASFECELTNGAAVVSAFGPCTSPHSPDLAAQPDGTYTFSVRQRDAAGNTSPATTSDYILDRGVPVAPSITSGPGATASNANPTWAFTGEPGATFECQLSSGATVISAFSACNSPKSYDLSAQADGNYIFSVRQRDAAGNTSAPATSDYTLDRDVPAAPAITSGPGPTGNDANPAWSFTGEGGATFECQLTSGAKVVSAFAPCSSPKSYDLTAEGDATYTFSVRQRDAAGNTSAPATSDYALDRGVPAAPTITSGPGPAGNEANPAWSFTGEAGAAFECQLSSGATVISAFAACSSSHSYDLSAEPDATYTFSARQRDAAGNVSAPATSDYTLDRGVPAAPTITSGPGPAGSDANPAWSFTGEPGATFQCRLSSGATVISAFASCSSPHSYDLSAEPDATYT